jgi:exonuclease VII small subunit
LAIELADTLNESERDLRIAQDENGRLRRRVHTLERLKTVHDTDQLSAVVNALESSQRALDAVSAALKDVRALALPARTEPCEQRLDAAVARIDEALEEINHFKHWQSQ